MGGSARRGAAAALEYCGRRPTPLEVDPASATSQPRLATCSPGQGRRRRRRRGGSTAQAPPGKEEHCTGRGPKTALPPSQLATLPKGNLTAALREWSVALLDAAQVQLLREHGGDGNQHHFLLGRCLCNLQGLPGHSSYLKEKRKRTKLIT